MLLKHKTTGRLVEIIDILELTNPDDAQLVGCILWGEDLPDPENFDKSELCFPSGEELPKCWSDESFQEDEVMERFGMRKYPSGGHALY